MFDYYCPDCDWPVREPDPCPNCGWEKPESKGVCGAETPGGECGENPSARGGEKTGKRDSQYDRTGPPD